ncbi:MAG: glycosyltransferase family 2 protein [Burkholderiales bacterium]|nr:glycosyltransferase family 2 protein [Burkholderiales bacterium]
MHRDTWTTDIEVTVLMPCLNEARTVTRCIDKAKDYFRRAGVRGEVLVADNGSDDGSVELAVAAGARVVLVDVKGYGNALRAGIEAASGRFVIMGDSDDSYDFSRLEGFVQKLREGYHLAMGNRFAGGIADGAMPWHHRYIGNPVLSGVARFLFSTEVRDFHCGLRGFDRAAILSLGLASEGMEFASEMVVKASLHQLRICEVPTTLVKDGRDRPPHLRSFRDGWRHLRFLFLHCPRWLFLYPGVALLLLGAVVQSALFVGPLVLGTVGLDVHTMLLGAAATIVGLQIVVYWVISQYVAWSNGALPYLPKFVGWMARQPLEWFLAGGAALFVTGALFSSLEALSWATAGFPAREPTQLMRHLIPSVSLLIAGAEVTLAALFLSIARLGVKQQVAQAHASTSAKARLA